MYRYRGGWWQELGLVVAFGVLTLAAATGVTAGLDEAVREYAKDAQITVIEWLAIGLNKLGQGVVVTWILGFGLTALLWWRTRRWHVFLPWTLAFVLEYVMLGPIKIWTMRTSPNSELPNAVEFFNTVAKAAGKYVMAYPSGHVANSIVWWAVIVAVAGRLWRIPPTWRLWMRFAPPVIVLCTTTYLGHHWLTDGLAALAIGLLIDRLVSRWNWEAILPVSRRLISD